MTNRKIQYWVVPPEADSEFVASMEEVLDVYAMPYNESVPVVCMDEQPVQLLKEARPSIVATKMHPKRVDYEYERAGTACLFMFVKRIDFCYTPKHGSWLNIAENELSSMTRQCLKNRRIGDIDTLSKQTEAWATKTNAKQRGVDWQFTVGEARHKLKSIYPKIKE
jgi:hypothetical protein